MNQFRIVRSKEEIEKLLEKAWKAKAEGSKLWGMSYEEGIAATIEWLTDEDADKPIED